MDASPLTALLARLPPRGMRCDRCRHWIRDGFPGADDGDCAQHEESTLAHEACVYWSPTDTCGLDYMGVPLASPLAQKD